MTTATHAVVSFPVQREFLQRIPQGCSVGTILSATWRITMQVNSTTHPALFAAMDAYVKACGFWAYPDAEW
jgi:hypothetical protein